MQVAFNDKSSYYIQIYEFVKVHILRGVFCSGYKLPSIRILAKDLGVSRNTVVQAYEQLLVEGYIKSEEKRGYFVEKLETSLAKDDQYKFINDEKIEPDLLDLNQSSIDEEYFPKQAWRKSINVAIDRLAYQYGPWKGVIELRETLQKSLFLSRGVKASVSEILIGAGTQYLLDFISSSLKFKSVAIEEPGYSGARNTFINHNKKIIPISINEDGISIEELSKCKVDVVYVTPSHQYPTGAVMPIGQRQKLLRWAEINNVIILEDDYDSEFRFKGKPIPSLQSMDKVGCVIYLGTFSKAFLPTMRMAYSIIPKIIMSKLDGTDNLEQTVSYLEQLAMSIFIEEGYWDKHLKRMRKIYREKHDRLIELLETTFREKIIIKTDYTGLRFLISFKSDYKEIDFITVARTKGYIVRGTVYTWINAPKSNIVTLFFGYGMLQRTSEKQVIEDLYSVWEKMISV